MSAGKTIAILGGLTLAVVVGYKMYKNYRPKFIQMENIDWIKGKSVVSVAGTKIELDKSENWIDHKVGNYILNTKDNYSAGTKTFTLTKNGRVVDTFVIDFKNHSFKNI